MAVCAFLMSLAAAGGYQLGHAPGSPCESPGKVLRRVTDLTQGEYLVVDETVWQGQGHGLRMNAMVGTVSYVRPLTEAERAHVAGLFPTPPDVTATTTTTSTTTTTLRKRKGRTPSPGEREMR